MSRKNWQDLVTDGVVRHKDLEKNCPNDLNAFDLGE